MIQRPKGTRDILPEESYKWQYIEQKIGNLFSNYGFKEIRVPVFEHTEVFLRSVGDTTDVVQKEMYTFNDKGGRSITLRPELTAGVIRSSIENGIVNGALPAKVCYIGGCYRYEKPQAGRLREFHQFGVECMGAGDASADAEVISLAGQVLENIGIKNLSLEINSIGCPECRKEYHKALKEYFYSRKDELCDTCKDRLERNPMRILDCKSPVCSEIAKGAPVVIDYLCNDCKEHFHKVKAHLSAAGIEYKVNPHIVRGLDYYTRTVFEFVSGDIGAQSTVCGGGRYDGLISQMGGPSVPSLGFAMGIERLMLVLKSQETTLPVKDGFDIYIASMGENAAIYATKICSDLRKSGFSVQTDICGRGLKAQMKYANKNNARFSAVLGEDEISKGVIRIKEMLTGEEKQVKLSELEDSLAKLINEAALAELTESVMKH
ncbi:MAG: histidine--tRNA ligase [Clostridia bacterium]|nr:histidine--tRNA ligase [Clostridia bacterium]